MFLEYTLHRGVIIFSSTNPIIFPFVLCVGKLKWDLDSRTLRSLSQRVRQESRDSALTDALIKRLITVRGRTCQWPFPHPSLAHVWLPPRQVNLPLCGQRLSLISLETIGHGPINFDKATDKSWNGRPSSYTAPQLQEKYPIVLISGNKSTISVFV